jgi:hypothetical protein
MTAAHARLNKNSSLKGYLGRKTEIALLFACFFEVRRLIFSLTSTRQGAIIISYNYRIFQRSILYENSFGGDPFFEHDGSAFFALRMLEM